MNPQSLNPDAVTRLEVEGSVAQWNFGKFGMDAAKRVFRKDTPPMPFVKVDPVAPQPKAKAKAKGKAKARPRPNKPDEIPAWYKHLMR